MRSGKSIWIDLENSPHVPFFKPIITELENCGFSILITARNCFQVCDLARLHNIPFKKVGRHYGKNKILKIYGILWRVAQLAPLVMKEKAVLAVSHGSRTQLILGGLLGVPTVSIGDYEHTQLIPFVHPEMVMVPDVIPEGPFVDWGKKVVRYPGIKEDVYVPTFRLQPDFLKNLGVDEKDVIITVRPPATEAHYHSPKSDELFHAVMEKIASKPETRVIMLPRNDHQEEQVRNEWGDLFKAGKIMIPDKVLDGLNLIWHSDLVISGGGTMNREAAALGVPVYSFFGGKLGAVDKYLSEKGRLTLLQDVDDLHGKLAIRKWKRPEKPSADSRETLDFIIRNICECAGNSTLQSKRH